MKSPADIFIIQRRSLLAMKLHALKDGKNRGHKDLLDIRLLLKYGHLRISEEELKSMCERYAEPGVYDTINLES